MKSSPSIIQLCRRIRRKVAYKHYQHLLDCLISSIPIGFISALIIYFSNYYNYFYNSWYGPFRFNVTELTIYRSHTILRWLTLDKKYLQIELGENQIYRKSFDNYYSIGTLLIEFPIIRAKHLPYDFSLFQTHTLQCIARQIQIIDRLHLSTFELIDQIKIYYDKHIEEFNLKVPMTCGILLGYIDNNHNVPLIRTYKTDDMKFMYNVIDILLLSFLFGLLILIIVQCQQIFHSCIGNFSDDIREKLNTKNIKSLKYLDELLAKTRHCDIFDNILFILPTKHLLIMNINFQEQKYQLLNEFKNKLPFEIIHIESITINFRLSDIDLSYILFPQNAVSWLHERLLRMSVNYQQSYSFAEEESRIRRTLISNEPLWFTHRSQPVSIHCLAEFRTIGFHVVDEQFSETTCSLCYEDFQLGDRYAQWPCKARHTFHHSCMLNVLRRQNQCPLCRQAFK